MEVLSDKTLVMIVGPAGVGKSTIMHTAVNLDNRFSYVKSFTTRPKRDGEESTYTHITNAEALGIHTNGKAITYFTHPTTGYIYGTDAQSYATKYNLLDTLSGAVETYQSLPFKKTMTFTITTDADSWEKWFMLRYPQPSAERLKRLEEAVGSIRWSLNQTDGHCWLMNIPDSPNAAANQLIARVDGEHGASLRPPEAIALYDRVKLLLSYQ